MLLKSLPSPEKHLKKQLLVCGEQVIWPVKRLDEWRPPSLCFNLTHTQSLLMCAVTQKAEVGIDVEERERKFTRDLMALARRQLSPEEADWLSQFTDPYEQRCQFMQLWTLKVDTN
jgi:4'-phosphopantetheinyl transferase